MPIPNKHLLAAASMAISMFGAASSASAAAPEGYQPEVSVRAGTLGIGPEFGIRIPDSPFGVRGNFDLFSYGDTNLYSHRFADGNATTGYDLTTHFDGSLRLLNGGLTLDYYPLGSGLRVSAGLYGNGDRITALNTPHGTARFGNHYLPIAAAGRVSLKVLVNEIAPYFGLGYSGHIAQHLIYSADAGVLVEGNPRVSIDSTGPIALFPPFQEQVEHERRRVENEIAVPVYPVLMLGLGYQF